MDRRIIGLLLAVAAGVTSVIVLLRAEKFRRAVPARVERVRGMLPRPGRARHPPQYITLPMFPVTSDAKGMTARAIRQVKQARNVLGAQAHQLTSVGTQDGC